MTNVTYTYVMTAANRPAVRVSVDLPRPDWWADATFMQRRKHEKQALRSPQVEHKLSQGYRISEVITPECECIVQQVEERDPCWKIANNTCSRCWGPLD